MGLIGSFPWAMPEPAPLAPLHSNGSLARRDTDNKDVEFEGERERVAADRLLEISGPSPGDFK